MPPGSQCSGGKLYFKNMVGRNLPTPADRALSPLREESGRVSGIQLSTASRSAGGRLAVALPTLLSLRHRRKDPADWGGALLQALITLCRRCRRRAVCTRGVSVAEGRRTLPTVAMAEFAML